MVFKDDIPQLRGFHKFIVRLRSESESVASYYSSGMNGTSFSQNTIVIDFYPRVDSTVITKLCIVSDINLRIYGTSVAYYTILTNICKRPCLLYTSPSPRDGLLSRMPSSA